MRYFMSGCRCVLALLIAAAGQSISATAGPFAGDNQGKRRFHLTVRAPGHPPVRLYAEEAGRGSPVVLLHGLGASGYTFRKIAPALARRHRVIAIDLKGHGRSDKPFDTNYSSHDQAVLIYWFMRQHGLRNVTLVGHSFGGQVALNLAVMLQHYDRRRIRRLVLISAPVYPQKLTAAVRFLRKPVLPYVALTLVPRELPIALALMSEVVGAKHLASGEDIDIYSQPYADAGARHAIIETARQILPDDAQAVIRRYRRVRQPALLIWCRNDHSVPVSTGRRLEQALPRAHLKVLDGCDHIPPEQRPGAVLRHMTRFLR
jgi:pimeloyl-ACP methyl ester carboxylesterase